jgi:hypothetical protein
LELKEAKEQKRDEGYRGGINSIAIPLYIV